jgi:hypothetical protein
LQPYVIKQGDHLALLAYRFGFDADTVWNDPQNAQLRQAGHLSQDPNVLYPTDMLYIPYPTPPATHSLEPGTTNSFVSTPPTVTLTLKFPDASLASQPFSVPELVQLTGLTTDGSGTATLTIPVTLETFTVVFTESNETFAFLVGHLDPIDTLSGVFQRLQNLGYIAPSTTFDSSNLNLVRAALRDFKADRSPASGGASPPSAPGSTPGSEPPASAASDSPAASSPASSPAPPSDSSLAPASSPGSTPSAPSSDDSGPPSSGPTSSPDSGPEVQDNAGLSDDGTLDDATSQLLVQVYGC